MNDKLEQIRGTMPGHSAGDTGPRLRAAHMTVGRFREADDLLKVVRQYLPADYWAFVLDDDTIRIEGYDYAGWTLDGYVLPRLASGLLFATEVSVP